VLGDAVKLQNDAGANSPQKAAFVGQSQPESKRAVFENLPDAHVDERLEAKMRP
jgi:hypothetical protein